nr:MAG TPA: hypothetical protein [Bacteriophage sp.]
MQEVQRGATLFGKISESKRSFRCILLQPFWKIYKLKRLTKI